MKDLTEEEISIDNFVAKIVIIGDSGTGKSTLLNSYKENYPSSTSRTSLSSGARMGATQGNKIVNLNELGHAQSTIKISEED